MEEGSFGGEPDRATGPGAPLQPATDISTIGEDSESSTDPDPPQANRSKAKTKYWIGLAVFLAVHAVFAWISYHNGNSTSSVTLIIGPCEGNATNASSNVSSIGMECVRFNQTIG
jgi:hypothetical protein